uniref:RNA-directed DNA polymerase n=1 Tax=Lepeophtheirus salmonis TaxID=72036 RepID=A0A0K2U171_LEPSM
MGFGWTSFYSFTDICNPSWSTRQFCTFAFIAEFNCDIEHVPGKLNHTADIISRSINNITIGPTFIEDIIEDQKKHDPNLLKFKITPSFKYIAGTLLVGFDNADAFRVAVSSPELRQRIVHSVHKDNHPGFQEMLRRVSLFYTCPNLREDVRNFARECLACQKTKPVRTSKTMSSFDPPSERHSFIHVDIIGPFPLIQGQCFALTIMDRFTRWPEVILIPDITSKTIVNNFLSGLISRFEVPETIVSNRGTQFTSSLWVGVCRTLGIVSKNTTSYHLESNVLIERFHRSFKTGLVVRMLEEKEDWINAQPVVLWGLRNSVPIYSGSKYSPFQLLTGRSGSMAFNFFNKSTFTSGNLDVESFFKTIEKITHVPPRHFNKEPINKQLKKKFVFVKNKPIKKSLSPTFLSPLKAIERHDRYYKLDFGPRTDNISIDRLRPVFVVPSILPACLTIRCTRSTTGK